AADGSAGAFRRAYPEASALLQRVEQGRANWLERLAQAREQAAANLEDAAFEELRRAILTGSVPAERTGSEMPALSGLLPRLTNILGRAHDLQREIYDIYADDRV